MSVPPPLWDALDHSISSGVFIDTKFIVFSKRVKTTGRIEQPRTLFANSVVVKGVPHLASRFMDDDKVTEDVGVSYVDGYDYDSDSDFEDGDSQASIPDGESLDPIRPLSKQTTKPCTSSDPPTIPHLATSNVSVAPGTPKTSHTIVIKDVAFVTFRALLLYLYTHEIVFALHGGSFLGRSEVGVTGSDDIQRPSAKSIYRLASKYNIPCLRKLALAVIRSNLRVYHLQDEAFSKLAAQYTELRDLFVQQLKVDVQSWHLPVTALRERFKEYAVGKLPHAQDAILMLYDLLSGDNTLGLGGALPPGSQSPSVLPPPTAKRVQNWVELKDAIVQSLSSGVFIDSKFYAPVTSIQPNHPPNLQPLHFCSSVNPVVVQKLNSELVEPKSDPSSNVINVTEGVHNEVTPTLKLGDWQSWRSIFLYMYTSEVSFTPSLNPSPSVSFQEVQCAPKPGYTLSDKIGLVTLKDLAFNVIRSKMNDENIVGEFFSKFSSENREIQEMQYKLLQEELKSTKSTSEIRQKIMESSLGQDPHCAAAITLVFEGLVCTESVPSPFSVTATPRPNQGSQDLPDFAPFYDKDPTDSFLTLAYHNISCMLPYRSLSPEEIRVHHYCGMSIRLQLLTPKQSSFSSGTPLFGSSLVPTTGMDGSPSGLTTGIFGTVGQNSSTASPATNHSYETPSKGRRRKKK